MNNFTGQQQDSTRVTSTHTTHAPRLIPLFWQDGRLVPVAAPTVSQEKVEQITILHTNDLHASIDGRPDEAGKRRGGLAKIATTIQRARAAGPTLAFDLGDIVFGDGTWWDIQGVEPVAILRGKAGCDLATIGNHDLEHGNAGLSELLAGGYPLVSANLQSDDEVVQRQIYPAYLVEIGGWRIGVTGLTTLSTYDLIPRRILQGITLTEPDQAALQVVAALEPLVESIIILSHLGFYQSGPGDPRLAAQLAGSRASLILGSHTHSALDPSPVLNGITICNAGAYAAGVGEAVLYYNNQQAIEVRTRLIPQNDAIPDDPHWLAARASMYQTFQPLHDTIFPLHDLPPATEDRLDCLREGTLLARALHASGTSSRTLLMVPLLHMLRRLPTGTQATLAEIMSAYPNIAHLVEVTVSGETLRKLIALQPSLLYYQKTQPLWIGDQTQVQPEQVEEKQRYTLITSELVREGSLGWELFQTIPIVSSRSLGTTCLQVIRDYLTSQQESV